MSREVHALLTASNFDKVIVDALLQQIAVLNEQGVILAVNQSWLDFAASNPPCDLQKIGVGVNYLSVCDAARGEDSGTAAAFAAEMRAVLRGEKTSFEMEYACHSPTIRRWFIGRISRIESGEAKCVVVHQNITQRKLAEERQHTSEDRFQRFMENSPMPAWITEAEGRPLFLNQAIGRLIGMAVEAPSDQNLFDVFPPEFAQVYYEHHRRVLETWLPSEFVGPAPGDGAPKYFQVVKFPITDAIGSRMVGGMGVDITRLVRAEEALKTSNAEIQAILDDTQRRARELAALNAIMSAVGSSLQLSRVLDLLQAQLSDELAIEAGAVFLDAKRRGALALQTTWGLSEADLTQVTSGLGAAFHKHRHEQEQNADFVTISAALTAELVHAGTEWETCLAVPLWVEGNLYGVAALFSRVLDAFKNQQLPFYLALGSQISVAIHNALLFAQIRSSREQLQSLSHQLIKAQENERRHIARELHDEIGQALTALVMNMEMAKRKRQDGPALISVLDDSLAILNQALQQVRFLWLDLHPSLLEDFGLAAALRWYLDQQAKRSGLEMRFDAEELETRLSEEVEITCYRIAQESVTNILRHSGATRIEMLLRRNKGNELELSIRDNGVGFDASAEKTETDHVSLGLAGMQERAMLAGGHVLVTSSPGRGTEVRVIFPLDARHGFTERRLRQRGNP